MVRLRRDGQVSARRAPIKTETEIYWQRPKQSTALSLPVAERTLRGIAVFRRNWLFADSRAGEKRAAAIYIIVLTCKAFGIKPRYRSETVRVHHPNRTSRAAETSRVDGGGVAAMPSAIFAKIEPVCVASSYGSR